MNNKFYRVGKIVNTHGLKGDVKVYPFTDYIRRFEEIEYVYIDKDIFFIEKVRYIKNMIILKFKKFDTINDVEFLKDKEIFIDSKNLRKLEDDEYMISDLIGVDVHLDNGCNIGKIVDVLTYSANDVYVVKDEAVNKNYLIPVVKEFILDINIDENKIIVKYMEGLLD